jgi:superfamily II DNA or RNA helicase
VNGVLQFARDPWSELDDGLRWYQREVALAAMDTLKTCRSALIVAATGLGKTQIFSAIAGETKGRVLVLAHREELVEQARKRLEQMTGEWVQREQGMFHAELSTRLIVASIDTMRRNTRLERYPRDHFELIICDEAHHYVGNTYTRPLEYFNTAKILGVTATPDRADEKALGMVFDKVAYVLDIEAGIDLGYLVPILGKVVRLDEIDISNVGKTGKDLAVGQLDEAMVKAVEGVVRETIRLEPDRQGICFFPGVKSAQYAAEKFNALKPASAEFLSGQTPPDERQQMVRRFKKGEFQYLCNCMVATEGFDAPGASLVVLARPTLSRALYTQMIGRGTRVLPGVVERYTEKEASVVRREAIRTSQKPNLMVLDFVGNSGRHELVTLEDVLGGRYTEAEKKVARKKREGTGGDPRAALEAARAELKALASRVEAKVKSEVQAFDPFRVFNVDKDGIVGSSRKPIGQQQWMFLESAGIGEDSLKVMSHAEARKMIETVKSRRQQGLCTYKQLRTLSRYGVTDPNLSFHRATVMLNYIQSKGWGRSGRIDPLVLERIATYKEPQS